MSKIIIFSLSLLIASAGLLGCTEDQIPINARNNPTEVASGNGGEGSGEMNPVGGMVNMPPLIEPSDEALVLRLALENDQKGNL